MPTQTPDKAVEIGFYEVMSSQDNSFVTTDRTIGMDNFGQTQVQNKHQVHRENVTWVRCLETGREEQYRSEGHSNSRPGHMLAMAKCDGEPVAEHNITTGIGSAIKTLTSYIFSPIFGGFAFAFMNVLFAPLALAYVGILALLNWNRARIGNLCVESKISAWPGLIKIERIMAVIQIVVLSALTYEWFFGDFRIGYQAVGVLKLSIWGGMLLWPAAIVAILVGTISRRAFDRKIAIELLQAVREYSTKTCAVA